MKVNSDVSKTPVPFHILGPGGGLLPPSRQTENRGVDCFPQIGYFHTLTLVPS